MIDKKISIFSRAINIMVITVMIILIINNHKNIAFLILGFALLILIYIIGNKINNKKSLKSRLIIYALNIIVILNIELLDATGFSVILFLIQVGEIIVNDSFIVGISASLVNYLLYIVIAYVKTNELNFYNICIVTINFTLVYILTSGIRNEIIEKGKAQAVAKELKTKTEELEKAYKKLQELYEEKEEVILLKEKNRIAGEIHDTVGHILTTVVVELEASKKLINKNPDLSLEKLDLAQKQVKKGLEDIRKSIRAFKEDGDLIGFVDLLKTFISEVEKNSDVTIEYRFSKLPSLDKKVENIIYRAIQEGITNGIRHGHSKKFEITLNLENNTIKLIIKDTGKGSNEMKFGFGLYNMKSKVEGAGGTFKIQSVINEGTTIYIDIPTAGEK